MATPTDVQSVTVTLRAGVSDATLPNNVKMRYGFNYVISLEDFSKLSRGARDSVIAAPTFNTATYIVPGFTATNAGTDRTAVSYLLDLSTINNAATLAALNADAQAPKTFAVGDVVRGFGDNAFKLVLASSGTATIAAGSVVLWGGASTAVTTAAAKAASTVTSDFSDVTAGTGEVAGVAIGTITAGQYGWIQIAGTAYATKVETNVAAGDTVAASDLTDETATNITGENQTVEVTGATVAEQYKIKFTGGTDSAAVLWDATAATVKTVIAGLLFTDRVFLAVDDVVTSAAVAATLVTVTGDGSNATPYNITFSSSLGSLPDLIEGAQVGGDTVGLTVVQVAGGSQGLSSAFGTAQTSADTGTANILIRSNLVRNLRSRERDIFRNARN